MTERYDPAYRIWYKLYETLSAIERVFQSINEHTPSFCTTIPNHLCSLQLKTGLSCEIMTYFCASRWKCSFILSMIFLCLYHSWSYSHGFIQFFFGGTTESCPNNRQSSLVLSPHRLYPSKLERPDIAHLYARWKFFLVVHRDSFLPTSAFRQ